MRRPLALVILLALSLACSRHERSIPARAEVPADDITPQDGGTVVRSLESEVTTLNPLLWSSKYDRYLDNYLFTPLVNLDADLRPVAGIAEKWDISPDGREYTFHLNPKATFSDGSAVTAADVLFTLRKIVDPQTEAAQIAGEFDGLDSAKTRIIDPHTIAIAFKDALSSQLDHFNDLLVVPEHVYGSGDFKHGFDRRAVGSGPYRLVSFDPATQTVLLRREDYWGPKPYLQRVIFKTLVDANTAWNALQHGDIDETTINSDIWATESHRPELMKRIDFRRFYTLNYNFIAWNEHDPLFADKRVRRALGMCVDLGSIIANVFHGTARAMNGPFTPDQYAYNPAVPVLPFDPTRARQMLNDAGWFDTNHDGVLDRNGQPFRFEMDIFAGSPTGVLFAQLLQEELKKIGVQMTIAQLDPALMLKRVLGGDFESAYMSWQLDPEPDLFQLFHSSQVPPAGQNFIYYSNPEADRLIDASRKEIDLTKRTKIYQQLHQVLADDQPYTWTVQVSEKWALDRRLRNVRASRGFGLFTWFPGEFDWWIPRDQRTHDVPLAQRAAAAP